jgi:hypothetical protein
MNKLFLIPFLIVLSGCATKVPVAMKFPAAPESLLITCKNLEQVKPNEEQLSEMLKVVVTNYGQYHECRAKVEAWIEWYKSQKEIHDSVTGKGN